jgi:cell division protein FtsL
MMRNITYAYKQAPWRKQLQGAAWVLVVLVIFVMIAIAYLSISAKTYAAGIAIQSLQSEQEALSNEIADLHNKLGSSTSYKIMTEKASKKGYEIISDSSRIVYLEVPGYVEPSPDIDVPKDNSNRNTYSGTIIKSVYTRSLWDLLMNGALKLGDDS